MRKLVAFALLVLVVPVLNACGSSGETVGQAAEAYCQHSTENEKADQACFDTIFERKNPSHFLGLLERNEADQEMVLLYCAYGSVSKPQLRGCAEHVTFSEVFRHALAHTEAGEYAVGAKTICGPEAGPGCHPRGFLLEHFH